MLLLGLVARLSLALRPAAELAPVCLADDAFYYLRIAEHILAGDGPTFDGRTATNGYHPLWMSVSLLAVFVAKSAKSGASVPFLFPSLFGTAKPFFAVAMAPQTPG